MSEIEIKPHSARRLAAIPHHGPYNQIGQAFEALGVACESQGLWPQFQAMVGVYYDDPSAVAPEALRSHAGAQLGAAAFAPPLEEVLLPEGRFAVMLVTGSYDLLPDAWARLYQEWLPASGETASAAASFEVYLNSPMDVAPEALRTELWLPLE